MNEGERIFALEHRLDSVAWYKDELLKTLDTVRDYCIFLKKKKNTTLPVIAVTDEILKILGVQGSASTREEGG